MPLTAAHQPLIRDAWKYGVLRYKLEPQQRKVYDTIHHCPPEEIFCVVCSRGFGKTFIGCAYILEVARRETDCNILIISSTLKKLRTIVKPAFDTILQDCPEEYQPKYNTQDSVYEFSSGVKVHLCAAEKGHIEDIRGIHKVVLVLIDESAFFGDEDDSYPLNYVIENILTPMFLRTKSKARIIMMSTPPEIPNHPFKSYFDQAKSKGCSASFDIYQSDIPPERIQETKNRYKDENAWRRECLVEWVVDESRLIIPEWKPIYVQDVPRDEYFQFYHKYNALDTGVRDFTIDLLFYYDFKKAKVVFEDEVLLKNEEVRTDTLAELIKKKELELDYKKVYRRMGDNNNLIILQDLSGIHKLPFLPTTKDDLFAMVNEVRLWVNSGRVLINPRCKYLIGCLENGIWDKKKKEFSRSVVWGHYDALAALCYAIRNIDCFTNPIPALYNLNIDKHSIPAAKQPSETYKVLQQALNIKKIGLTTDRWKR